MTDATTPAGEYAAGAESVRSATHDPQQTYGNGIPAGDEPPHAAESERAADRPVTAWPGVVRPAGWFLSASGEAAPPAGPGTEPVRSDAADRAGLADRAELKAAELPSTHHANHWPTDPHPTSVYQTPQSSSLFAGRPAAQSQAPVVGPTEALRGRAGGPGFPVPPGAVAGLLDPNHRSGWQLAQDIWHESGVGWEPETPPQPNPASHAYDDGQSFQPGAPVHQAGPVHPIGQGFPFRQPHPAYPAHLAGQQYAPGQEYPAAQAYLADQRREYPADHGYPAERGYWGGGGYPAETEAEYEADEGAHGYPEDQPSALGETYLDDAELPADQPAQPGRADHAYRVPPDPTPTRADLPVFDRPGPPPWPADGWQPQMRQPHSHRPRPSWNDYPAAGLPGQAWPSAHNGQPSAHNGQVPLPPRPVGSLPLGAPVAVGGAQAQTVGQVLARPPYEAAEPDELFRAWQGSVRAAARPRGRSSRRHQAWQAAKIGVPAAVIITVGAGALMMLTGKADKMLAVRADNGSLAGNGTGNGTVTGLAAFTGYPGQHGLVTVGSVTTGAGVQLAVGSADGHPAIWRRPGTGGTGGAMGGAGTWTLVSQAMPAVSRLPGAGTLSAVAHGMLGWIAVGQSVTGATTQPVVLTSADGVTWQPLTVLTAMVGPGTHLDGVAAGHGGYAVVGRQMVGGRTFALMWWSADLKTWQMVGNGGLDGRLKASAAYAVAATAAGFVAVGSHGSNPIIWTSPDGRRWTAYDVPVPPGTLSASLRVVTASGARIAAAGSAVTSSGDVPFAVVSTSGGAQWREVVLSAPSGLGTVSALTVAGNGFVAAGQAGPAGGHGAVTWSTTDGLTWSAATSVGAGASAITALTTAGGTILGVEQRGADPAAVTITAP
jgi:hypothetical protein